MTTVSSKYFWKITVWEMIIILKTVKCS